MTPRRLTSERGAVIIHVGIALLGLLAFSALSVDYGIKWTTRRQAQNAADAGALAGALSLAWDDPDDFDRAREVAEAAGSANPVWGQAPDISTTGGEPDVIVGPCPPSAPGLDGTCVRVNVYRNQQKDPLPTVFARLLGVTEQGARATATAQVFLANASDCLKPWAIPDKWYDNYDVDPPIDGEWTADDKFERYYQKGPNKGQLMPEPRDEYVAPSEGGPGSSFVLPADYGLEVRLKHGSPSQALQPGWYTPIQLPQPDGSTSGGADYEENIATCNGVPVGIGDWVWNEPGNMTGPTVHGADALIEQDPNAYWDPVEEAIVNSCTGDDPPCGAKSPRLVAIPVFDPDAYAQADTNGSFQIQITNILGFFIDRIEGNSIVGYLMTYPGLIVDDSPTVDETASFLKTVALIR